jgi:hypothetical protein
MDIVIGCFSTILLKEIYTLQLVLSLVILASSMFAILESKAIAVAGRGGSHIV